MNAYKGIWKWVNYKTCIYLRACKTWLKSETGKNCKSDIDVEQHVFESSLELVETYSMYYIGVYIYVYIYKGRIVYTHNILKHI